MILQRNGLAPYLGASYGKERPRDSFWNRGALIFFAG